jgi:hypothetical protein
MLTMIGNWLYNEVFGWGGVGALISAAAWALWFFCPAVLLTYKSQLLSIAIAATVFTLAQGYFFTSGYNKGYQVAVNQVAAQNKDAKDAVNKVTSDVGQCFDSGGNFNDVSGLCEH